MSAHPDQAGENSDVERFARYAAAYKTLGNPDRRRKYNQQRGILIEPRPLKPGHDLYQRLFVASHDIEQHGTTHPITFVRYDPCSLCWCEGCQRCSFRGLIPTQVTVKVKIPDDFDDTITLIVEGEGGQTEPGGTRGDLLVYVTVGRGT